jgi:hypothetical protein
MNRFIFFATLATISPVATVPRSYAEHELTDIKAEVAKRHDETVKRLQDWIGQVSIAAENRGYPKGAAFVEYRYELAK